MTDLAIPLMRAYPDAEPAPLEYGVHLDGADLAAIEDALSEIGALAGDLAGDRLRTDPMTRYRLGRLRAAAEAIADVCCVDPPRWSKPR